MSDILPRLMFTMFVGMFTIIFSMIPSDPLPLMLFKYLGYGAMVTFLIEIWGGE